MSKNQRRSSRHRIVPLLGSPVLMCVVGLIVGLLAGGAWSVLRPPEHQVETTYMLRPPAGRDVTEALTAGTYVMNRTKLYKSLMTSDELAAEVSKQLSGTLSPTDVLSAITVADVYRTTLLTLTVTAPSSDEAMLIARGYAEAVPFFADQLEQQNGVSNDESMMVVVDGPRELPASGPLRVLIAATVLFGVLGIGLAFAVRRRFLVGDVMSAAAAIGVRPLSNINLADAAATDNLLAKLLISLDGQNQATLVSPRSGDGAEACADALASAAERIGITADVRNDGSSDAELAISVHNLMDEACLHGPLPKDGLLVVARKYTTTKSDLATIARIVTADGPLPVGVVVVNRRVPRRKDSDHRGKVSAGSS